MNSSALVTSSTILLFGLAIFILYLIMRSRDKDIKSLKDLFKPERPTLKADFNKNEIKELQKRLYSLRIGEALMLFRTILGSSYKAIVEVTGDGIKIEGLGTFSDVSDENKEEITG